MVTLVTGYTGTYPSGRILVTLCGIIVLIPFYSQ